MPVVFLSIGYDNIYYSCLLEKTATGEQAQNTDGQLEKQVLCVTDGEDIELD